MKDFISDQGMSLSDAGFQSTNPFGKTKLTCACGKPLTHLTENFFICENEDWPHVWKVYTESSMVGMTNHIDISFANFIRSLKGDLASAAFLLFNRSRKNTDAWDRLVRTFIDHLEEQYGWQNIDRSGYVD